MLPTAASETRGNGRRPANRPPRPGGPARERRRVRFASARELPDAATRIANGQRCAARSTRPRPHGAAHPPTLRRPTASAQPRAWPRLGMSATVTPRTTASSLRPAAGRSTRLRFRRAAYRRAAMAPRNPPWTTDEVILALSLYFREGQLDDTDAKVIQLSGMLDALPIECRRAIRGDVSQRERRRDEARKLCRSLDPNYPGVGLSSVGRRDREIWEHYTERRDDCHRLADALRSGSEIRRPSAATGGTTRKASSRDGSCTACMRPRSAAEPRSPQESQDARAQYGRVELEVCESPSRIPPIGSASWSATFSNVHHTKPLHTLPGSVKTTIADLAIVCPTCHRALHRSNRRWRHGAA